MTTDVFNLLIVVLFVILFLVILFSLKAASIFGERTNIVLSICVAILCIMSMFDVLSSHSGDGPAVAKNVITVTPLEGKPADSSLKKMENRKLYHFILLPYLALLITVPGVLLILALMKIWSMCRIFVPSSLMRKGRQGQFKKTGSQQANKIRSLINQAKEIKK